MKTRIALSLGYGVLYGVVVFVLGAETSVLIAVPIAAAFGHFAGWSRWGLA